MQRPVGRTASLWSVVLLLALGCGQQGPARFKVTGTVTIGGSPVASGWICFTADSSKGNTGPQGAAPIKSGTFSTAVENGKGTVGGPMIVHIDGFDGNSTDASPNGRRLFAPYEVKIDLPRDRATVDFDIPASWTAQPIPAAAP